MLAASVSKTERTGGLATPRISERNNSISNSRSNKLPSLKNADNGLKNSRASNIRAKSNAGRIWRVRYIEYYFLIH